MLEREQQKLYKKLGERIKDLRKKAGYTSQETFAYDAEIPRALYGRYEKGVNITISNIYKITKFHKISLEDFFSQGFDDIH